MDSSFLGFNTNYNPLSCLSPCSVNKQTFFNNTKDDIFEGLVNPLSEIQEYPCYQDENMQAVPKNKFPSLNLDVINKADTTKIFAESVLSCFDSPIIKKSDGSTKEESSDGSAQSSDKIFYDNTPIVSSPKQLFNFFISPKSCYQNCMSN